MSRIGEEVSEKLDIVPAKVQVLRTIRYKYACKNGCQGKDNQKRPAKRIAALAIVIAMLTGIRIDVVEKVTGCQGAWWCSQVSPRSPQRDHP